MIYSELSYPFKDTPTPHHFQHIADWQDMQRTREIRRKCVDLIRSERRLYRTAIQLRNEAREIREGCERALEKFSA